MSRHGERPDALEAAVRASLLAEDLRVAARAAGPADRLAERYGTTVADVHAAADAVLEAATLPTPAAQCRCDGVECDERRCEYCKHLDPELPCPSDAVQPLTAQAFGALVGPRVPVTPEDFLSPAARAGELTANLPVSPVTADPEPATPYALPVDVPPAPVTDREAIASPSVTPAPSRAGGWVAPATSATGQPYTWAARHDAASVADYNVRDRLTGKAPLRDLLLPLPPALDQGPDGDCVGFGCTDAVRTLDLIRVPSASDLPQAADAVRLYTRARQIDGEAVTDPAGTSVLAGMKAGVEAGWWGGYLWADGTSSIAQAILQLHRPVVVGVPWHDAMERPGAGGVLTVAGGDVGGHCVLVNGITLRGPNGEPGPWFRLLNSWGDSWGVHGCGWIFHRNLAALLHDQGEAAIPMDGTA